MSKIIAGRFDKTVDADAALEALRREGFTREEVDSFYVSPPGQHAGGRMIAVCVERSGMQARALKGAARVWRARPRPRRGRVAQRLEGLRPARPAHGPLDPAELRNNIHDIV